MYTRVGTLPEKIEIIFASAAPLVQKLSLMAASVLVVDNCYCMQEAVLEKRSGWDIFCRGCARCYISSCSPMVADLQVRKERKRWGCNLERKRKFHSLWESGY